MALTAGTTYIELRAKLDQFQRDLEGAANQAGTAGEKAGKSFTQKLGEGSKRLTSVGRKMTTRLTLPIVAAGGLIVDAASDLNESLSKVDVVFGKNAETIRDWSETAAESMGISRQQALEAAGTFGNLFTAMEIGQKPATDMSKGIVQLASDLASFNNANPEDVLLALRSGLVGEAEPLRKFGIQISAARTEAEALAMGLAKTEDALTDADMAQARYSLILQDSTKAQGDFKRTSEGVANQQRILKARFKDTAAEVGTSLLPIGEKLLGWVGNLAAKFNALSPEAKKMTLIVAGIAAVAGPVVTAIGAIGTALGFLAANPIVLVVAAVVGLTILIVKNWDKIKEVTEKVFGAIGRFLSETWASIKNTTADIVGGVLAWLTNRFADFLSFFIGIAGGIVDAAAKAFGWVPGIGDKIKDFQRQFHESTKSIIADVRAQANEFQGWGEKSGRNISNVNDQLRTLQNLLQSSTVAAPGTIRAEMPGGGAGAGPLGSNLITIGRNLQAQGFSVGEHPAFGGVSAVHTAGSYHYIGRAIDINWPGPDEQAVLTGLGMKFQAMGLPFKELLGPWNDPNHRSHLHAAMDSGGWVKGPATVHIGNIRERVHFTPEDQRRNVTNIININGGDLAAVKRVVLSVVNERNHRDARINAARLAG